MIMIIIIIIIIIIIMIMITTTTTTTTMLQRALNLCTDPLASPKQWKEDMSFGTWNVRSLCMAG
jgi:hypothetical protein